MEVEVLFIAKTTVKYLYQLNGKGMEHSADMVMMEIITN